MDPHAQGWLVPFEVVALPNARVVLRTEPAALLTDDEILQKFAFVIDRSKGEGARRVVFAERYGGLGIFNNGGGVRCGLVGSDQVKGIGLNPLLGRSTPSVYKSGAMNGVEAVREFIWAHLINHALPHGAPRVHAVIDAGLDQVERGKTLYRRHLIVRETRSRVAYLERASHFKPKWKVSMLHDGERTKVALERLAGGKLSGASTVLAVLEQLYDRLQDIAARQAEQLASAKIRRLNHGALSSSNACMDGAWLDFGSFSQEDRYRNDPNFRLRFWGEHEYLLDALKNICHVIELYSHGRFPGQEAFDRLVNAFGRSYEGNLAKEACGLLGLEEEFLRGASGQLLEHLRVVGIGVISALKAGNVSHTWTLGNEDSVNPVFAEQCAMMLGGFAHPSLVADGSRYGPQFLASLAEVGARYAATHKSAGRSSSLMLSALVLDAARRAMFVPDLEASRLNAHLESVVVDKASLEKFVAKVLVEGETAFSPRTDAEVLLCGGAARAVYDPVQNIVRQPTSSTLLENSSRLSLIARSIIERRAALMAERD